MSNNKNKNILLTDLAPTQAETENVKGGFLFGLFGVAAGVAVAGAAGYVVYETLGGGETGTKLNAGLGGKGVMAGPDGHGDYYPSPV